MSFTRDDCGIILSILFGDDFNKLKFDEFKDRIINMNRNDRITLVKLIIEYNAKYKEFDFTHIYNI